MLTVVTYDITDNTQRSYLIKRLQHFGLKRVQKSVFTGYLDLKERNDLAEDIGKYLSGDKDSIIIFPVCESCRKSTIIKGNAEIAKNDINYRFI